MSFTLPINCLACYLLAQKSIPTTTIENPHKKLKAVSNIIKRPVLAVHPSTVKSKEGGSLPLHLSTQ